MFGEAGLTLDGVMGALSNLGGFGVMSWVLYTLHTRSLESQEKRLDKVQQAAAEQLAAEREMWSTRFDRLHEANERLTDEVKAVHEKVTDIQRAREIQSKPDYQRRETEHQRRLKGGKPNEDPSG